MDHRCWSFTMSDGESSPKPSTFNSILQYRSEIFFSKTLSREQEGKTKAEAKGISPYGKKKKRASPSSDTPLLPPFSHHYSSDIKQGQCLVLFTLPSSYCASGREINASHPRPPKSFGMSSTLALKSLGTSKKHYK